MKIIKVLAYNRPLVLRHCLASLNEAYYLGQQWDLDIFIDGPREEPDRALVEASLMVARSFEWRHGSKRVVARPDNLGVLGQWLNCYDGTADYALIVEEDVELTPLFPLVLQQLLPKLQPNHYGLTLQRPQWQLGQNEHGRWRRLDLIRPEPLFSFPAIGTWGQLLVGRHWRTFLQSLRLPAKEAEPSCGSIYLKWGENKRLFTPTFMAWQSQSGLTNLYTYLTNDTALAISTQPRGVNFKEPNYFDRLADEAQVFSWLDEIMMTGRGIPRYNECFDLMLDTPGYNATMLSAEQLERFLCGLRERRTGISAIESQFPAMVRDYGFIPSSHGTIIADYTLETSCCLYCPYRQGLYPDR